MDLKLKPSEIAMLRAIRLKDAKAAVHWMVRAVKDSNDLRIAKLLYYSALKDNLNVYLMQRLCLEQNRRGDGDISDLAISCWSLALSPKPYEHKSSQEAYMAVADLKNEVADYPGTGLLNHLKMGLVGEDSSVYGFLYELYKRDAETKMAAVTALREGLEIVIESDVFLIHSVLEGCSREIDSDFGVPFLLLGFARHGICGQEEMKIDEIEVLNELDSAGGDGDVPDWADSKDRRFDESWLAQANMILMFREYGKVDPKDEGVLFKTKGGEWNPVIKPCGRGVYQIQSESDPTQFYEVLLGTRKNVCTCLGHVFRGAKCKHIRQALQELPFRMEE